MRGLFPGDMDISIIPIPINCMDELKKDLEGALKIMETNKEHVCNCENGVDWDKLAKQMKEEDTIEEISEINIDWLLFDVIILKAECLNNQKLLSYCQHLEDQLFRLKNKEAELKV